MPHATALTSSTARRLAPSLFFLCLAFASAAQARADETCPTALEGPFAALLFIEAGQNPAGTVAADFNNDGRPDLAVGNESGRFSVYLGDGGGGFPRSASVSTGVSQRLRGLAAADFNGDAKIDLAVADPEFSRVLIYIGRGDGTFTAGSTVPPGFGRSAAYIKAADFNNDAKIDLIVTYGGSDSVNASVLLGDGAGNFSPKSNAVFDANPSSEGFAVGDLNGDGKMDAAFARFHARNVFVMFGDGAGNLTNLVSLPMAHAPLDVAAHDFNGDGRLDLAVTGRSETGRSAYAGFVSVAPGDGGGGFGAFAHYRVGSFPASLVAGEFNGDGAADIAVANDSGELGGSISLLTGDGVGNFSSAVIQLEPGFQLNSIVAADFDLDGKTDLAASRRGFNNLAVLLRNYPPRAIPCVLVAGPTGAEGDAGETDANFTVTLSQASAEPIQVSYFFRDGSVLELVVPHFREIYSSAVNGTDYRGPSGTIVFAPGETTKTVTAKIIGDTLDEYDEPFELHLSAATNATIVKPIVVARIRDDDASPIISVSDASAPEGSDPSDDHAVGFTVSLSVPTAKAIMYGYNTSPGTAAASDYLSGRADVSVFVFPGEQLRSISVSLTPDTTHEPDETFFVNLSPGLFMNVTMGDGQAQGTILNDDPRPTIIADNRSVVEGAGGARTADVSVRLSNPSYQTVTASYATVDGTAAAGSDYVAASGTLTFDPGESVKTVPVTIVGDDLEEEAETFGVRLSDAVNATLGGTQGVVTIVDDDDDDGPATLQFPADAYVAGEGAGAASVTVTRSGDLSAPATVTVETVDDPAAVPCDPTARRPNGILYPGGVAYARCDYATTVETLTFGAGEAGPLTVLIPLVDDRHAEGTEVLQLRLTSPGGASLGTYATATLTINDNDGAAGSNPISGHPFFVRQHYLDFLSREPEAGEPWTGILAGCPDANNFDPHSPSARCDRLRVSESFFQSPEFYLKGFYSYLFYRVAFGRRPEYSEIIPDMRRLAGATPQEVFERRALYAISVAQRPEFTQLYGAMTNQQYVDALLGRHSLTQITTEDPANFEGTAQVTLTRQQLIDSLNSNSLTRAQVLRAVVQSNDVDAAEYLGAFAAMQYYGYLRRSPEEEGYQNWLRVIRQDPQNIRRMVNGFVNSFEYRLRFGPIFEPSA